MIDQPFMTTNQSSQEPPVKRSNSTTGHNLDSTHAPGSGSLGVMVAGHPIDDLIFTKVDESLMINPRKPYMLRWHDDDDEIRMDDVPDDVSKNQHKKFICSRCHFYITRKENYVQFMYKAIYQPTAIACN